MSITQTSWIENKVPDLLHFSASFCEQGFYSVDVLLSIEVLAALIVVSAANFTILELLHQQWTGCDEPVCQSVPRGVECGPTTTPTTREDF
jgi:hypothetical protein